MSRKDIAVLFNEWNSALASRDADRVIELYEEQGLLLPTLSDKVRSNRTEMKDYFVDFLTGAPQAKINEFNIKMSGDLAVNSGVYTFTFSTRPSVKARFTFVYQWNGRRWMIAQHHSSQMPWPPKTY